MARIVIDTNVIVSAALGKGFSSLILFHALFDVKVFTCVSNRIINEYKKVGEYSRIQKKYPQFKTKVSGIIASMEDVATMYEPAELFNVIKDKPDNAFLDVAYEANAHYLITGNYRDFTFNEFYQTKIVNPKTFWSLYLEGNL